MARILVIDDEQGMLSLLGNVLRDNGHEVFLAERGRKGVQLFQQKRPQATILDFLMPDLGGLAVLREIRTLDPRAPVIMLTGWGTEERERQAREFGAAEFLEKELALPTLGATLDRVLTQVQGEKTKKDVVLPIPGATQNRVVTQVGKTMMGDGQRQFPRGAAQFAISLLRDGVKIGDGTGYDLSAGGCTVASQVNIGKGDRVSLQLYLPDGEDPITPLMVEVAAVRWIIQQRLRVEFISLPSGDQQRLRRYLRSLQTTSIRRSW